MTYHTHRATTDTDFAIAKALFLEYAQWLDVDLCFQNFNKELENIAVEYGAPKGGIFLLKLEGEAIGCVGVRALKSDESGTACELKRMYIREGYRGNGNGKRLLELAIDLARSLGYKTMWLDTLSKLETAIALYQQYGFVETQPYYQNPLPMVRYFEKVI